MRLVLEVKSGELAGRKKWLRLGERMLVGRTDQAELAVGDPKMSSVHFYVECTTDGCRVHDTRSTNGTYLNGKQIEDEALQDGDVIVAGDTQFGVEITDDASPAVSAEVPVTTIEIVPGRRATAIKQTVATRRPAARDESQDESREPGTEKLPGADSARCFRANPQDVASIIQGLGTITSPYLIFDFSKIGRGVPESLTNPSFLYDWLPEKQVAGFSPVMFGVSASADWQKLLGDAWGHNCFLCVFSSLPEVELLQRLRDLTATGNPQEPRRKYASPEGLVELLSNEPEQFAKPFFGAADAVMFEMDSAEVCCVRVSHEFVPKLLELGLTSLSE